LLLIRGWGLEALIWGYAIAAILTLLCYVLLTKILLPHINLNPFHFDVHEARKMFSFSLRLYITQAAVAVHNQIEKLFLAMFVGVAAAGWYDIASDIALKTRGALALVLGPVLPAASELGALGDKMRLSELYHRAQKYLAFIGLPVVCYVAANSSAFVATWLGPTLKIVAVPLAVLTCVNFLNLTTGPGFLIFAGNGNLKPGVESALLGITLNVVLSAALISTLGFAGAVIGTSIALTVASFFFLVLFYRDMHYPVTRVLREGYLKPVASCAVALSTCWLLPAAIRYSWAGLAVSALLFGTVYMSLILASRFFDRYDWAKVEAFFPAIRLAKRYVPVA
jgi:O-antigen/teichoic acid export membrane protein